MSLPAVTGFVSLAVLPAVTGFVALAALPAVIGFGGVAGSNWQPDIVSSDAACDVLTVVLKKFNDWMSIWF